MWRDVASCSLAPGPAARLPGWQPSHVWSEVHICRTFFWHCVLQELSECTFTPMAMAPSKAPEKPMPAVDLSGSFAR